MDNTNQNTSTNTVPEQPPVAEIPANPTAEPTPPSTPSIPATPTLPISVPLSPETPTSPPVEPPIEKKSPPTYVLFLVGAAVIIIAVAAFTYLANSQKLAPSNLTPTPLAVSPTAAISPTMAVLPTLSTSDDLGNLEKDAQGTTMNDLDQEDAAVNKDLQEL